MDKNKKYISIILFLLSIFIFSDSIYSAKNGLNSLNSQNRVKGQNNSQNRLNNQHRQNSLKTPKNLQPIVESIRKLPEAHQMIESNLKEGSINITSSTGYQFEGLWDRSSRTLHVNPEKHNDDGQIICTILFELHNAATSNRIHELGLMAKKGKISKDEYVEMIERMEHDNALKTVHLLNKGIESGLFPVTAKWNIEENFDKHYEIQKKAGHSAWIARTYDHLRRLG